MSDKSLSAVTYGDLSFDVDGLPRASVVALLRKGLAHFLGNEQSSKVTAWKASDEGANASDDAIAAKKAEYVKAAVEAITNGTMGANTRGPRGTALETIMRRMATAELKINLAKKGLKLPEGDKTLDLTGADGAVTSYTRAAMVERRLAHPTHGARIRKAAEKEMAALNKQADAVGDAGGVDLLDL